MASKRVLVVGGGFSNEREVSLRTGRFLYESIRKLVGSTEWYDLKCLDGLLRKIQDFKPTVVVNALHGGFGEDGRFQAFLDTLQIPYTGSGHSTSALCMDKYRSSLLVKSLGAFVPDCFLLPHHDKSLHFPLIVKPNREGSSVGISLVHSETQMKRAIRVAKQYDPEVLVQKFVRGVEITVPVIFGRSFTPIEIRPKRKFYDYVAKYTKGMTDFIIPSTLSKKHIQTVKTLSEKLATFFNVRQYCRIDYIFSDGKFYFLELNTLPGFTETSLMPRALAHEGYEMSDFLRKLLMTASFEM